MDGIGNRSRYFQLSGWFPEPQQGAILYRSLIVKGSLLFMLKVAIILSILSWQPSTKEAGRIPLIDPGPSNKPQQVRIPSGLRCRVIY